MGKFKYEKYDYTKIGIGIFKRLKSTWTVDLARDVQAFHNIDAERELTAILSEQIAAEVDRAIAQMLSRGPVNVPTYISNEAEFFNVYNNETSS